MQREVNDVNKHVKSYNSKIVYSTVSNNGCSVSWRADWARFRGKTYAQVLKSNIDSPCVSRVKVSSKPRVIGSSKKCNDGNTVPSINLPAKTNSNNFCPLQGEKTVIKNVESAPAPVDIVCPIANRFTPLALNTEEQKKDCNSDNKTVPYSNTKQLKSTKRVVKVCKSAKNGNKVNLIHSKPE